MSQIIRKWSVLDCRQKPAADVYELSVLENEAKEVAFVRTVNNSIVITMVPFGKLTPKKLMPFAEEHVRYLEKNFCFCAERHCLQQK
jgi:hypothetical protein